MTTGRKKTDYEYENGCSEIYQNKGANENNLKNIDVDIPGTNLLYLQD